MLPYNFMKNRYIEENNIGDTEKHTIYALDEEHIIQKWIEDHEFYCVQVNKFTARAASLVYALLSKLSGSK